MNVSANDTLTLTRICNRGEHSWTGAFPSYVPRETAARLKMHRFKRGGFGSGVASADHRQCRHAAGAASSYPTRALLYPETTKVICESYSTKL